MVKYKIGLDRARQENWFTVNTVSALDTGCSIKEYCTIQRHKQTADSQACHFRSQAFQPHTINEVGYSPAHRRQAANKPVVDCGLRSSVPCPKILTPSAQVGYV